MDRPESFPGTGQVQIDAMKAAFMERFSGYHSREASMRAFRGITFANGESMETYMDHLKQCSQGLAMPDAITMDQFLSGLPTDANVAVSMSSPATP